MKESWSEYSGSIEKSREFHRRYQIAVNHPLRRKILKLLHNGKSQEEIRTELNLDERDFEYHLQLLEWGFCIERDAQEIRITKEGSVVEYIDQ
ncbi:helix-turn-helix transcriptional regulator [Geoglobus acetivorans]|uniref:Transcriptional regulatory protein, putative n=1 Tax=Geoglobus acetivorans TaxID=565033 RepID=A0A0A7GGM8_GEOAI|nr:transcriptional regulatory protein, putative [Geoglobus acetivorans]